MRRLELKSFKMNKYFKYLKIYEDLSILSLFILLKAEVKNAKEVADKAKIFS